MLLGGPTAGGEALTYICYVYAVPKSLTNSCIPKRARTPEGHARAMSNAMRNLNAGTPVTNFEEISAFRLEECEFH